MVIASALASCLFLGTILKLPVAIASALATYATKRVSAAPVAPLWAALKRVGCNAETRESLGIGSKHDQSA